MKVEDSIRWSGKRARALPRPVPPQYCPSFEIDLTVLLFTMKMMLMNTADESLIPLDVMAELGEAGANAAKGLRDPDAARRVCYRFVISLSSMP